MSAPDAIASYYDDKTRRILDRYGPGPDVHYHAGIVDEAALASVDLRCRRSVRDATAAAQRRLVDRMGDALSRRGVKRLLDAGCGLGGPAIRLLTRDAVEVADGVTLSTQHPPIAATLAAQAGVSNRARFRTADLHALGAAARPYDAAIALESSCYFDRPRAFATFDRLLRPEGALIIVDCFQADAAARAPFDAYWRTSIGTVDDYVRDASSYGFALDARRTLNEQTWRFWDLTVAAIELDLSRATSDAEHERLIASRHAHQQLQGWFASGAIGYRWLTFIKETR